MLYFPLIDLARFIAALAVMTHHYFWKTFENNIDPFSFIINHGGLGVQLFFIISGFVIHFSIKKGIKNYAISRLTRIFPIFWIICTATYLLTIICPPHAHQSLIEYLRNMSIITKGGDFSTFVDGSYWTLRYELFFYLLVGLVMFFIKDIQMNKFYIGLTISSLLIIILNIKDGILGKLLISKFALLFTFGGYFAYILIKKLNNNKIYLSEWLFLFSVPFIFILENYIMSKNKDVVALNNTDLYTVVAFFIIIPILSLLSLKIKNEKVLNICKTLGAITYPLYLIHQKPGQIIIGNNSYGTLTTLSFFVAIMMILISYYISKKELFLRKKLTVMLQKISLSNQIK